MPGTQSDSRYSTTNDPSLKARRTGHLIVVRSGIESDKNFIYSTWLKGLYYGNEWFREIPKDIYFNCYSKFIGMILSRPTVYINVACLSDDVQVVLSYAVLEAKGSDTVLHWIFTKSSWRKIGIARSLLPDTITTVTHLTKVGKIIKPKEWDFVPFMT